MMQGRGSRRPEGTVPRSVARREGIGVGLDRGRKPAAPPVLLVECRGFFRRRRGAIDRHPLGQQLLPLGQVQLVQDLLRAIEREAGNPCDAPAADRLTDGSAKLGGLLADRRLAANWAVGAFDEHRVGRRGGPRRRQERRKVVAQVARKQHATFPSVERHLEQHARRTGDVPGVEKRDAHARADVRSLAILDGSGQSQHGRDLVVGALRANRQP